MLAPGDYLTTQVPAKPAPELSADRRLESPKPAAPAAEPAEPEPRSFLLRLMSALGAIHT